MTTKILNFLIVAALLAGIALSLSACNTMEGIGRDAQAAGEALTGAASKTKGY